MGLLESALEAPFQTFDGKDLYPALIQKAARLGHSLISNHLERQTSSTKLILEALSTLYERIVDPDLLVRKINVVVDHLVDENSVSIKE